MLVFQLNKILQKYIHGDEVYTRVRNLLNQEMNIGLSKEKNASATVKMFITYVQSLPNGTGMFPTPLVLY